MLTVVLAWVVSGASPAASDAWSQAQKARARLDFVSARRFFEAVVAAPEGSIPTARRAAAQLGLGETCVQLGDVSCARAAFVTALELDETISLPVTAPPQAQRLLAEARVNRPRSTPPTPLPPAPTPTLETAEPEPLPPSPLEPKVRSGPPWAAVAISGAAAGALLALGIGSAFASQTERSKLLARPLPMQEALSIEQTRSTWAATSVAAYAAAGVAAVVGLVFLITGWTADAVDP